MKRSGFECGVVAGGEMFLYVRVEGGSPLG